MKRSRTNKKGFTVVELVIVIAVIAVLAAVLIPTFANLVSKAKNSADTQMVANINKYLASMEAIDGKNITMYDAMQDAEQAGYNVGAFLGANNTILWNQETDRFLAVGEGGTIIAEDTNEENKNDAITDDNDHLYWAVYNEANPIPNQNSQTYSIYWAGTAAPAVTTFKKVGFDAGDYITPSNVSWTIMANGCNIIVRTQGGKLSPNGNVSGEIHHYGYAHAIDNKAGGYGEKFYEHGYVGAIEMFGSKNTSVTFIADGAKFCQDKSTVESKLTSLFGTYTAASVEYGAHMVGENGTTCVLCNAQTHTHTLEIDAESSQAATCSTPGLQVMKCTGCSYSKIEIVPTVGHDWEVKESAQAPTCEQPGFTELKQCKNCQALDGHTYVNALGHDWDENGNCKHDGCTAKKDQTVKTYTQQDIINAFDNNQKLVNQYGCGWIKLAEDVTLTYEQFINVFAISTSFEVYDMSKYLNEGVFEYMTAEVSRVDQAHIDLGGHTLTLTGKHGYYSALGVIGDLTVSNGTWVQQNGYALFYPDRAGAKITLDTLTTKAYSSVVMVPGYTNDKKITVINSAANITVNDPSDYTANDVWYRTWNTGVRVVFSKDAASTQNITQAPQAGD